MDNVCSRIFQQCWHCAVEHGLLDDQDIELLELVVDHTNAAATDHDHRFGADDEQQQQQCHHGTIQRMLLLFTVLTPSVAGVVSVLLGGGGWLCCSATTLFVLLTTSALLFVLLIPFFIFWLLPRFACWHWARHVDDRFRHFVLSLRQRELALFGLRHCSQIVDPSSSASLHLPFRAQRIQCLRQLCHFVRTFNTASVQLALTSNAKDSLLVNFVGDEMRTLCDDAQRGKAVDDNDLDTNSLKSLWQYHFLVRSEFVRVALLALRHDVCWDGGNLWLFARHLALIFNTVLATASLSAVASGVYNNKKTTTTRTTDAAPTWRRPGTELGTMSPASVCCAQLEWALDRMNQLSSSSSSADDVADDNPSWPPPIDVVKCMEHVAVSLRHAFTECQRKSQSSDGPSFGTADVQSVAAHCDGELGRSHGGQQQRQEQQHQVPLSHNKLLEAEDYQIFELDLARQRPSSPSAAPSSLSECISDGTNVDGKTVVGKQQSSIVTDEEEVTLSRGVGLTHDAMLRELGAALTRRKELCLRRELRALARARGVPDEAVPPDELDRTPFGGVAAAEAPSAAAASSSVQQQPPAVNNTRLITHLNQQQTAMPPLPSADTITAQRAAILGGMASEPKMEQYGEDDNNEP